MAYSFFIGRRYSGAKSRNALVSFISRISMAGMVLGVAVLIVVLSLMNGFDKELRERILGLLPHVSMYHRQGLDDWASAVSELEKIDGVQAAAPFIEVEGLLSRSGKTRPAIIYGIDTQAERRVSVIADFVDPTSLAKLEASDTHSPALLGSGLAKQLGLKLGQGFRLIIPSPRGRGAARVASFTYVGQIHSGTELDQRLMLASLKTVSPFARFAGKASGLRLKLDDLSQAPKLRWQLSQSRGYDYFVTDWTQTQGNLYHAVQMSKKLVSIVLLLIIAIAAFNVVSTLVMVVVEKEGSIAILRTMGASGSEILSIFIYQGAFIGLVGTGLGILLGSCLAYFLPALVSGLEGLLGIQFLQSDVYPISYVPSDLRWLDVLWVAGVSLGMSLLATIYPAWRATKIRPAQVLRYE